MCRYCVAVALALSRHHQNQSTGNDKRQQPRAQITTKVMICIVTVTASRRTASSRRRRQRQQAEVDVEVEVAGCTGRSRLPALPARQSRMWTSLASCSSSKQACKLQISDQTASGMATGYFDPESQHCLAAQTWPMGFGLSAATVAPAITTHMCASHVHASTRTLVSCC